MQNPPTGCKTHLSVACAILCLQAQALVQYLEEPLTQVAAS